MLRGGRMTNSPESVFSDPLTAVSPMEKLLPIEGEKEYHQVTPEKRTARSSTKELVGSRTKRGASTTGSSKLLVPTSSRSSKKTMSTPPSKAHHRHRRSPSENVATSTTANFSSAISPQRTLRQSASFSGGISTTPSRPTGGRPPTNSVTSSGSGSAPRSSSSKLARHGSGPVTLSSSRRRILAPLSIELEGDGAATCCQQSEHNVQVFIRARPVNDAEIAQQGQSARCVRQENAHTVAWLGQPETSFTFDHVANETVTQEEVFQVAGLPMVDNCMAGYNSCMFAYGQTGSGKTHTMLGDLGDCVNQGMTPRVFEYLFAKIRQEEEAQQERKLKYKCRCSFLEIYNEQISDLLEPSSSNLQMREDGKKGVFVEGLLEVEVQTVEEVLHLLLLGATNRKVAATHMNRESSRSHSVFTCVVESQWECDSMINFRFGRLNLVDLAGSERQKDTGVDEDRLREAASINKSLSTLGLVIMVLVDIANGKQRHVPYRDSKLTFLLQDSLGGNSKTAIIANISPSSCASSETLSTLKFAQRAKFIHNNAVVNEESSGGVKGLHEQIQQLKDELAHVRRQGICKAEPTPTVLNHKVKAMEALLVGVLRREKVLVKTSAAEIEHLALLVKQREDETYFHYSWLQSQEPEIRTEACDAEESVPVLSPESELMCNNLDHRKLAVQNIHLQRRLRRCQGYDELEERESMVHDISNLRNNLLDILDTNLSTDTAASLLQQDALVAELAAERQTIDQLRNEVESCQRDLAERELKLQASLDSNERVASEVDALRMELENSREECNMHKKEVEALQMEKALGVNCLELEQAQHQQFVLEFKTQLQKSEERVAQEMIKRSQIELQLQEALQEATDLQTELQWTRDSLEEAESVVETFQRSEPAVLLEIGDPEAAYEDIMVGQLQAEIVEMHARLEEERRQRRELENQSKANNNNLHELLHKNAKTNGHKQKAKSGKSTRKVRHQDAVLQLQLELDSVDGGASLQPMSINQLELDMEAMQTALAEERQHLTEAKASCDHLRQQLEHLTQARLKAETALNASADLKSIDYEKEISKLQQKWESAALRMLDCLPEPDLQTCQNMKGAKKNLKACNGELRELGHIPALVSTTEWWMSEIATLASWARKKRQLGGEKELLQILVLSSVDSSEDILTELKITEAQLEELVVTSAEETDMKHQALVSEAEQHGIDVTKELEEWTQNSESLVLAGMVNLEEKLMQYLDAAHDLQYQIELKEAITKLKEQAVEAQERWVLENAELVVAIRESEDWSTEETVPKWKDFETVMQERESLAWTNTATGDPAMDKFSSKSDIHLRSNEHATHLRIVWLGEKGNDVAARAFTKFKIEVLQYPPGKVEVELARTHVLLTASEEKVKLLSTMVAKFRENDGSDLRSCSLLRTVPNVVSREDQECNNALKASVFSPNTENAPSQHPVRLLETEGDSTTVRSTIAKLQRELQEKSKELAAVVAQLHVSDRHVFKLECQSVELRDAMRRQAVAFGVLYEEFHSQESSQGEKAELLARRDSERQVQPRVDELLQQELERMQASQTEKGVIHEDPHSFRSSAAMTAQKIEQLRSLVEDLERNRGQLQQEVRRKQSAIQRLEKRLLVAQQHKRQCREDLHLCKKLAEVHRIQAQEKQGEVEILGKSVEELENTVYALESQVGLLKRESGRQRLVREDMESELQVLQLQSAVEHATLTEASRKRAGVLGRETYTESSRISRKGRSRSWRMVKWAQIKMLPFPSLGISKRGR